jgi:predicted TIM-barrel fold metal-dependent hydrolase
MIFDLRTFIGESFEGRKQSVEDLLRSMDALEIEMAMVSPLRPLSYNLEEANHSLVDAITSHNDRLVSAVRVDPWQPDAANLLVQAIEEYGCKALFLNPWEEHFKADSPRLDPLLQKLHVYHIPLIITTGYPWLSEALQVCSLAMRWPDVPVVMTNGGQINISGLGQADATLALHKASNLYIETAGVYRQDFIEEALQMFGPGRVLYGSGSPYFDQRYELLRVKYLKVTREQLNAIMGDNALKLLGLNDSLRRMIVE